MHFPNQANAHGECLRASRLHAAVSLAACLLTTAWGLSIAIPAYIVLYWFSRRIGAYERVVLPRAGTEALGVLFGPDAPQTASEEKPGSEPAG